MKIKIALAGNPNSGKTTIFNELTGSKQYVGNWPGVTVEKKEGRLRGYPEALIIDLPGIYSLSPYSLEEVITRQYLIDDKPDVIINVVDASNIERNLYLTTQLTELGIPVLVVLNMMDMVSRSGNKINAKILSKELGVKVVEASAIKGMGLSKVIDTALSVASKSTKVTKKSIFSKSVEQAINNIEKLIKGKAKEEQLFWYAIKLFERDEKVSEQLNLDIDIKSKIQEIIAIVEKSEDNDAQSIITNERYIYIDEVIKKCYVKEKSNTITASDKIDNILTNRFLALPIFFAVMWLVYFVSIQLVGNTSIVWLERLFGALGDFTAEFLGLIGVADWIIALIVDGIIGGVGSVISFVPMIMVLFFFISVLEDCGYMSRIAFIMDRVFKKIGLSGKSFIPMVIGVGCSVPGILASRTIESEKSRKMTIILTPFIPCGAKLPVFALMAGAFFPDNSWAGPSMYLLGFVMIIVSGLILKNTKLFKGENVPFVMELPPYRMPSFKSVAMQMWDRGRSFIIKAGTVIFIASVIIWFMQSFSFSFKMVTASESMLASIGRLIAPVFTPLGFGNWQSTVSVLTGFVAKENVVATFGILFGGEHALVDSITTLFTPLGAYSFMAFILLAAPCIASISAIKREMASVKWTLIAIGYQTGIAYLVSLIIYQVGSLVF